MLCYFAVMLKCTKELISGGILAHLPYIGAIWGAIKLFAKREKKLKRRVQHEKKERKKKVHLFARRRGGQPLNGFL